MRALVIYESEFGATRAIAEAIGRGLAVAGEVEVVDSRRWREEETWKDGLDLLVVGTPTHARTLPTPASRRQATEWTLRPGSTRRLERDAIEPGIREWLLHRDLDGLYVAAFATRADMSRLLAGSAAPRIARATVKNGATLVGGPQDFLVRKDGGLVDHELDHAFEWGRVLASAVPVFAEPFGDVN
jgi:hypothetical protein